MRPSLGTVALSVARAPVRLSVRHFPSLPFSFLSLLEIGEPRDLDPFRCSIIADDRIWCRPSGPHLLVYYISAGLLGLIRAQDSETETETNETETETSVVRCIKEQDGV